MRTVKIRAGDIKAYLEDALEAGDQDTYYLSRSGRIVKHLFKESVPHPPTIFSLHNAYALKSFIKARRKDPLYYVWRCAKDQGVNIKFI